MEVHITLIAALLLVAAPALGRAPACTPDPWAGSREVLEALMLEDDLEAATASGSRGTDLLLELAGCLEAVGFLPAAQFHYRLVLRSDEPGPAFEEALEQAFRLGHQLGDLHSLTPVLVDYDEDAIEPSSDDIRYAHGLRLLQNGEAERAAKVLQGIAPAFGWYALSRLHLGVARERSGEPTLALDAYRQAVATAHESTSVAPVVSLALIHAARLMRDQGFVEDSAELYSQVDPTSPIAGHLHAEVADMWLDLGDPDAAGPHIRAARAAQRHGELVPSVGLLEARALAAACRPNAARRRLHRDDATRDALEVTVTGVSRSGTPSGQTAWALHLGPDAVDVGLPDGVLARLRIRQEFDSLQAHLAAVETDLARLRLVEDEAWQATVGVYLTGLMEQARTTLRGMLGELLLDELHDLDQVLVAADAESADLAAGLDTLPWCAPGWRDKPAPVARIPAVDASDTRSR